MLETECKLFTATKREMMLSNKSEVMHNCTLHTEGKTSSCDYPLGGIPQGYSMDGIPWGGIWQVLLVT